MVEADNVDSQTIGAAAIIGAIITVVLMYAAEVYYYRVEKSLEANKTVVAGVTERSRVQAEQQTALSQYRWVDKDKQIVAMPVDKAMSAVVRTYSAH